MKKKYDLIVVGGGTSGCACAYTAAKEGLDVLLIEKNSFLGGTMTSSLVTPAMKSNTENSINTNFYETLMTNLNKIGGQITYSDGNIGWFNPELVKIVLEKMLLNIGVELLLDTEVIDIKTSNNRIEGLLLNSISYDTIYSDNINHKDKMLLEYIEPLYVVDGTGNAKIFEKLNLEFLNNFENKSEKNFQPATLRFIMSGINIKNFADWITQLDTNREVTTSCEVNGEIHLSTAYTWDTGKNWALEPVFRSGIEEGLIKETDSNYFQVFSIPGMPSSLAFNCPRIVENSICIYDKEQVTNALIKGRESILRLSDFFKKKFTGFENAYISSIANSLGIRVSNRIKGKYIYTIDDLKSGKKFDNPVLISKYPVDVHSDKRGESVLETQDIDYMLPIESLMSVDFDNLFAIGRCISSDFLAQGALRIIPSCFSMGEGLAKYLSNIK